MASTRRKEGTRYWVCCYTDHTGAQRQCSSKTTNRTIAQQMADAFESAYRRRMTETQLRQVMSGILDEVHHKRMEQLTLKSYFGVWLARVKPEVKPSTFERYKEMTKLVEQVAPDVVAKMIDDLEADDFVAIRNRVHVIRSSGTTNLTLKNLKYCISMATADRLLQSNPAATVSGVKRTAEEEAAGSKRPFTIEEVKKLLTVADDEWRGMILAGYYSGGQRLSDIATLTAGQVDKSANAVVWPKTQKTGRTVITPITGIWGNDLTTRLSGKRLSDPLFPRAHALYLKANRVSQVSNRFRALLARAGLATRPNVSEAVRQGRRTVTPLSFHSFRHTATSLLNRAGVAKAIVMDIVGHENEGVSQDYTHIDNDTKRIALGKLPAIGIAAADSD